MGPNSMTGDLDTDMCTQRKGHMKTEGEYGEPSTSQGESLQKKTTLPTP